MDAEKLSKLLEKVKAATGPSDELDARIHHALHPDQKFMFDGGDVRTKRPARYGPLRELDLDTWGPETDPYTWEGFARAMNAQRITSSIDASLALVEKMLPGAVWFAACQPDDVGLYSFDLRPTDAPEVATASAPTFPLAILQSLLSALSSISKGEHK